MDHREFVKQEPEGWFGHNWMLVILNLVIGAVVICVIWFCSKQEEEEEKEEEPRRTETPKKEKSEPVVEVKAAVEVDTKPVVKTEVVTTKTVVEKVVVEDIGPKEVPVVTEEEKKPLIDVDLDFSVKVPEPVVTEQKKEKEIVIEEDVGIVEDVADLHNESEDHLHFLDQEDKSEATTEQESADSSTSDLNGEGFVVVKQTETSETTVTTTVKSEDDEKKTIIPEFTKYEIDVKTGNKSGAGTDANVFIIIYGEHGYTSKIALENSSTHKHKFEKNHTDSFCEEAINVGQINKIRIGHDNKGGFAGWYLDSVIINVPALSCQWTFEADRWLDTKEDDKKIEIDLVPSLVEEFQEEISYVEETVKAEDATSDVIVEHVTTTTTTSEEVLSSSGEILSSTSHTETENEVYTKPADDEETDDSTHVTVETVVTHSEDAPPLSIDEDECKEEQEFDLQSYSQDAFDSIAACMEITDKETGVKRFDMVMPEGMDFEEPSEEDRLVGYSIDVKTGDKRGAGTDANVFIIIFGTKKDTGKLELKNSLTHKNAFEKSHVDTFQLEAIDVGKIGKITIGHDNKGGFAGWYLDYVTIDIPETRQKEVFVAHRWLDKKEDDKKIVIDVYPQSSLEESKPEKKKLTKRESQEQEMLEIEKMTTEFFKDEHDQSAEKVKVQGKTVRIAAQNLSFAVQEYDAPRDVNWRLATVDDVLDCFDDVKEVLKDNEWYLCTLVDGYIGGAGFNYEISGDLKKHDHKLMVYVDSVDGADVDVDVVEVEQVVDVEQTPDFLPEIEDEIVAVEESCEVEQTPDFLLDLEDTSADTRTDENKIEFQVVEYGTKLDEEWRLACIKDVESNMEDVKHVLHDKDWYICALIDGSVAGPAYHYNIETGAKELGHKLVMKGGSTEHLDQVIKTNADHLVKSVLTSVCNTITRVEFKISTADEEMSDSWRLSTVEDVHKHSDSVNLVLNGLTGTVVGLVDGSVTGDGCDYEIKEVDSTVQHKMLVREIKEDNEYGKQDDTLELLGGNVSVTTEVSLNDTSELLVPDISEIMDLDGSQEETDAAMKIQSIFRGKKARKEVEKPKEVEPLKEEIAPTPPSTPADEIMDLDGSQEETDAAMKIQAVFRGKKARKEVETPKEEVAPTPPSTPADEIMDLDGSQEETDAAMRIQAVFRGKKARKDVEKPKEVGASKDEIAPTPPSTPSTEDVKEEIKERLAKKTGSDSDEEIDEEIEKLFKKFDKDGDGQITAEEFMEQFKKEKEIKKAKKKAKKEKRASRDERKSSKADKPVIKEVEFQVVDFNTPVDVQWRLASTFDCETHMDKVKTVLADKTWHICALEDGSIGGPGYNYGIRFDSQELGHKLLTNAVTTIYYIDVKTGDVGAAGTDANVYIIIYGIQRVTEKIFLNESLTHKSKFERDHTDSFEVEALDVGPITKILIGHDNKGGFAGWYLDNVEINKVHMRHKLTFIADRWLDTKEGDGKIEIELAPLRKVDLDAGKSSLKREDSDDYEYSREEEFSYKRVLESNSFDQNSFYVEGLVKTWSEVDQYVQSMLEMEHLIPTAPDLEEYIDRQFEDESYSEGTHEEDECIQSQIRLIHGSVGVEEYIQTPVEVEVYIQSPVDVAEYIQSPVEVKEYIQSPVEGYNSQSPTEVVEFVQVPVDVEEYVQSPMEKEENIQSPVEVQEHIQSLLEVEEYMKSEIEVKMYAQSSDEEEEYTYSSDEEEEFTQSSNEGDGSTQSSDEEEGDIQSLIEVEVSIQDAVEEVEYSTIQLEVEGYTQSTIEVNEYTQSTIEENEYTQSLLQVNECTESQSQSEDEEYIQNPVEVAEDIPSPIEVEEYTQSQVEVNEYTQSQVEVEACIQNALEFAESIRSTLEVDTYSQCTAEEEEYIQSHLGEEEHIQSPAEVEMCLQRAHEVEEYAPISLDVEMCIQSSLELAESIQSSVEVEESIKGPVEVEEYTQGSVEVEVCIQSTLEVEGDTQTQFEREEYTQSTVEEEEEIQTSVEVDGYIQNPIEVEEYIQSPVEVEVYTQSVLEVEEYLPISLDVYTQTTVEVEEHEDSSFEGESSDLPVFEGQGLAQSSLQVDVVQSAFEADYIRQRSSLDEVEQVLLDIIERIGCRGVPQIDDITVTPAIPELQEEIIVEASIESVESCPSPQDGLEGVTKEEEEAAIKIQSLVRGNQARKEVDAMKTSSAPLLSVQTKEMTLRGSREDISVDNLEKGGIKIRRETTVEKIIKVQTVEVRIDDEPVSTEETITVEDVGDLEASVTFDEDLPELVSYEIDVKTGDVRGAGTDANVFLTIFGEKGDTGKIVLATPKGMNNKTFERNCIDSFVVEALDVGNVTSVRIGHDNKGGFSGWYLERVNLNIPSQKRKMVFHADRWIDTKEEDGKLEIDLTPFDRNAADTCSRYENVSADEIPPESKVEFVVDSNSPLASENDVHHDTDPTKPADNTAVEVEVKEIRAEKMNYQIDVHTGDVKFAGTDANVFIILYGEYGYTTKIDLRHSLTHKDKFERKQVDTFEVETLNVGNIEKIRIGHDNKGGLAGWYLDDVKIRAPSVNQSWTFNVNRWLDKHKDDGKLEVDVPATK